jgi:hypothetical protein
MISLDANITAVERKLAKMIKQLEQMPVEMKQQLGIWQQTELHRSVPETDQPTTKSVRTRKKGRQRRPMTAGDRALRRLGRIIGRRVARRIIPPQLRALRRYARIGRRPLRLLMPAPIRRLRRFERQARRIARGRPAAVYRAIPGLGRVFRTVRRARLQAHLWEALGEQMGDLARNQLKW